MNSREKSREELEQELEELKQAYGSLQSQYEIGLSERRLAEAELSESERRFMQVAESAGEWIWEVDANGLYTYSSPLVEEILGYTPDEIVGKKHFYEFFNAENKEETKRNALQLFSTKQTLKEFVNQNVHKDGTLVWLSTTGSPILDKNGELLGYQGVDTDITERRKVEEALKESEYFFKESQKSAFIGSYKTDFKKGKWESSEVLDQIFGIGKDYDRSVPGWLELVHPGDREMMNNYLMDEVLAKRMSFDKEYRIVRKNDGQIRWVHGQGQVKFDDDGNALSLIGTIQDITQRKLDEEEINKLNYAVEATGEVVFMTDNEGMFTYVNPAFSVVYGHRAGDVVGKVTPRILKSGRMDEATYKYFWEELIKRHEVSGELINKTKDGAYLNIESSTNAIINERGEAIGYISIQKDISVRKKIEEELVQAKERAEESDRLKSAFLANMSHEIRTPMNGILGFSALLSKPGVDIKEQQNYIRMIEKSSARLFNLINEIIDVSKIESGQMEIQTVETNINEQLELAYNLLKPDAENKGITLSYQDSLSVKDAVTTTDRAKFYSIITNLVKNAIKYTDQGTVEFGCSKKEKFLEFYVKDTGIGIPENRLEAIFERFVKAETVVLQAREGAGLGLSISKAFLEMLGGKIWVKSEVGKGSIFYFTLPYQVEGEVIPQMASGPSAIKDASLDKKLRILIAEDDETSGMLLSALVSEYSRDTLIARTGIEALETYRNNPDIDLILMDIQMPEMDGYEASRQIRKLSEHVVIIAQTAYGILGDREKAIESGCNDYISKPISYDVLAELMHRHLGD
jgi:PAS domain S-box-containing protein